MSRAGRSPSVAALLAAPRRDALERRLLLSQASGLSREDMARSPERILDATVLGEFERLVEQRERGVPIAYLLGRREFYGRSFKVDARVLIPRAESELLVDLALNKTPPDAAAVLDIGTGSGCLAITLKLERPRWSVSALDISSDAIAVARENARTLKAEIELLEADIAAPDAPCAPCLNMLPAALDLIVSNPPYIAANDPHLLQGDLRFEPKQALTDASDGFRLIDAVIGFAKLRLRPGAWLLLEHGYDQAEAVRRRLAAAGLSDATSWCDLAGIERVSGALATG